MASAAQALTSRFRWVISRLVCSIVSKSPITNGRQISPGVVLSNVDSVGIALVSKGGGLGPPGIIEEIKDFTGLGGL
jgi:hypothetical protein